MKIKNKSKQGMINFKNIFILFFFLVLFCPLFYCVLAKLIINENHMLQQQFAFLAFDLMQSVEKQQKKKKKKKKEKSCKSKGVFGDYF